MLKRGTRNRLGPPPPGRPARPETRARHCPVCQSDQTAPAEHVIISRWVVVEEEYRCAACEGVSRIVPGDVMHCEIEKIGAMDVRIEAA